jgi:hypothetical protein
MGLGRTLTTIVLGLALVAGTGGCGDRFYEPRLPKRVTLEVGESYYGRLRYGGMSDKETFSIISHRGRAASSLHYPIDVEEICHGTKKYKVIEVTPEHLILDDIHERCRHDTEIEVK